MKRELVMGDLVVVISASDPTPLSVVVTLSLTSSLKRGEINDNII